MNNIDKIHNIDLSKTTFVAKAETFQAEDFNNLGNVSNSDAELFNQVMAKEKPEVENLTAQDRILQSLQHVGDNFTKAEKTIAKFQGVDLSPSKLITLQKVVAEQALTLELASKIADKASNAFQTLFKNQ